MAEAIAGLLIELTVTTLVGKIKSGLKYVTDSGNMLEEFNKELEFVKALLSDAAEKMKRDGRVKTWLFELQNVVYDAEDLLEKFDVKAIKRRNLKKDIEELRKKLNKINGLAKEYGIDVDYVCKEPTLDDTHPESSFLYDRSETVGMQENINHVKQLLEDASKARVIAVVGLGGLGKTLLLKHILNDTEVKESFEALIWVHISQKVCVKKCQVTIGTEIDLDLGKLTEEQARKKIYANLEKRKFLLVLDDVWSGVWRGDRLLELLGVPLNDRCKIAVTTRNSEVANEMGVNYEEIKLKCLSEDESKELFRIHAFSDCNRTAPSELENVANEVASQCAKLPLAIKTIAAFMRGKRNLDEWKMRLDELRNAHTFYSDEISGMTKEVLSCLILSYDALPSHLKHCFLYCCLFPEGEEIDCLYLIQLWIAEGFVCVSDPSINLVAKGRTYLNELINCCLIEPSKMEDDGEAATSCKMNDLVRDMALFISEQGNRCMVIHPKKVISEHENISSRQGHSAGHKRKRSDDSERMGNWLISLTQQKGQFVPVVEPESHHQLRRISLISNSLTESIPEKKYPPLRPLMPSHKILNVYLKKFPLLRMFKFTALPLVKTPRLRISKKKFALRTLMLSASNLDSIPSDSLKKFPLLRVLDVSRTKITSLPKSVGRLKRLEHLNASHCTQLKRLPDEIGKLECLRHLDLTSCCKMESLPKSVVNLKRLEHLNACHGTRLPDEIGELECLNLTYCCNLEGSPKSVVGKRLDSAASTPLKTC
eukprot:Gb_37038 [translate_table: standard]